MKKGLEFGKIYRAGNFTIKKFTRVLTGKQMRQIRDEAKIPHDVQKRLERSGIPFIKVANVAGTWCVEWSFGTTFFEAFDNLHVNDDGELFGVELENVTAIITCMYADTNTVGDLEYQRKKLAVLNGYIMRASKTGEPTPEEEKENEEAADEVLRYEEHKATLTEMGKEAEK